MPTKNLPRLSNLQTWMRGVLTSPHGVSAALKTSKKYLHIIGETKDVSREKRLSIYGDGYFARLIDVLGANYSSVKNVIGNDLFEDLIRRYLIKHPSTFRSIDDVGDKLSIFLKSDRLLKKYKFLPELAEIEWAAHQSFFADDIPGFSSTELKSIPQKNWPKIKFKLDPSVKLLKFNWPVDRLWRDDGKWSRKKIRAIKKESLFILVIRLPNKLVRVPRINAIQYELLKQFQKNKNLGSALLYISKNHKSESLPIRTWFEDWCQDGVFKKIIKPA